MAADWRGWRLIVVNGERFRWRYADEPWWLLGGVGGDEPVRVRFEFAPSHLLTVRFLPLGWRFVRPRDVREWIEFALTRGWPVGRNNLEIQFADRPGVSRLVVTNPNDRADDANDGDGA